MYFNPYPYNPNAVSPHYTQPARAIHPNFVPIQYYSYYQPLPEARVPDMYPPVDTHELHKSAKTFQTLMKQTDLIVNKIIISDKFAHDLMEAAQKSNQKKVDELILSTGIKIKYKATFSPDGITIRLQNGENDGDCCTLAIALRW